MLNRLGSAFAGDSQLQVANYRLKKNHLRKGVVFDPFL